MDAEKRMKIRDLAFQCGLKDDVLLKLNIGQLRVLELLQDGLWHSSEQINLAAGGGHTSKEGLRRLRELRDAGVYISKGVVLSKKYYFYKLGGDV